MTYFSVVIATKDPNIDLFRSVLDSLDQQTFSDFNIVIVDDGSLDPKSVSEAVPPGLVKKVQIFRNEQSVGQGAALNIGIANVSGPYVIRVDDDDVLSEGAFNEYFEAFQRGYEVCCLNVAYRYLGKVLFRSTQSGLLSNPQLALSKLSFPFAHSGMAFSKKIFDRVGGYDVSGVGQDFSFFVRLLQEAEVYRVLTSYVLYNISLQGNSMKLSFQRRQAYLRGYEYLSVKSSFYLRLLNNQFLFDLYQKYCKAKRIFLIAKIKFYGEDFD